MITENSSNAFKSRDANSYDSVASEYDLFTERLSGPLAEWVISLARITTSERVLDIGSGTGIVALQAARQVGPHGKVLGVDLSEGMLATAQAKAAAAGLSDRAEFRKMDAEALDLASESFDVVVSLFALLHFPNPLVALKEMLRVLRPGGRLCLAVGSGPPRLSVNGLIYGFRHLRNILLKRRGKLLTAPEFLDHLVETRFPVPDKNEVTSLAAHGSKIPVDVPSLVRKAGFTEVSTTWQRHQRVIETPEEFWDLQRTYSSMARKRLSSAPPEQVEAFRKVFLERCHTVQSKRGQLVYPFAALYVVARRPRS